MLEIIVEKEIIHCRIYSWFGIKLSTYFHFQVSNLKASYLI